MRVTRIVFTPTGGPVKPGQWYYYGGCFHELPAGHISSESGYVRTEEGVDIDPPVPEWCKAAAEEWFRDNNDYRDLPQYIARHWREAGEPTP